MFTANLEARWFFKDGDLEQHVEQYGEVDVLPL